MFKKKKNQNKEEHKTISYHTENTNKGGDLFFFNSENSGVLKYNIEIILLEGCNN